ncbi:MAG TPA: Re/Si-specific NAD(P)(+) transhydrogenase subunit alpha [Terriglobia bacterium]|nr:Re/Si-specific NAD(P)(+) transhydrogenase subunit alpha [Terriglobia bacterium]
MTLNAAVPKETEPGERRVAATPAVAQRLAKLGVSLRVEHGAGIGSGVPDAEFLKCATFVEDLSRLYSEADIVLRVACPEPEHTRLMRDGAVLVCFVYSAQNPEKVEALRQKNITTFAMELIPRISRAQSLDALSSQAVAAGYKAVLLGAEKLERFLPMLTTAAGTIRAAKVLVIGAGVAGLQAIATARRLGAQVEGYDIRSSSQEEVESLGARFVSTGIRAEGEGGYARQLTPEERQTQQEILAQHVRQADIVVCAANVPGRPAPKILLKSMVDAMKPGSVIVDLAADTGGNCDLTAPDQEVKHNLVTILGPRHVASMMAEDASRMYAQNICNLLSLFVREGKLDLDWTDEIISGTVLTHGGEIKNEAARHLLQGGKGQ